MLKRRPLFKGTALLLSIVFLGSMAWAETPPAGRQAPDYSKRKSGLYRDFFDQELYYGGTEYLHLERFYQRLFGRKNRSLNVNAFDEVPDSTFFINRHGRERMSMEALKKGPSATSGPDAGGKWSITKGKFEGVSPGFFVRDPKGEKYLLKFDPLDYLELSTGAEIITSRFMHALGYNVPQYTLAYFKRDQLEIEPGAKVYDKSGFRRKLTPERLEEFMIFVPQTEDGSYRASASRILEGEILGPMPLQGRRRNDPDDPVDHKDRREIRALQVFGSWLNNYDLRESNSLDVVETERGRPLIRHYLIDFNASLGSRAGGPKPALVGHEYLVDFGEIFKGILGLGLWKKPWQKRWDEAGREITQPSVGYFDNRYFNPGRYKTILPYFPFKDLTRSDGFWAAKLILSFTDEEIRALVSTGEFSDKKAEETLAQTLIERRDLVGRFWFRQANPLDEFRLFEEGNGSYELRFEDLAVRYRFETEKSRIYHFDVIGKKGTRGVRLSQGETQERSFKISPDWLVQYPSVDLLIRSRRQNEKGWSPFVRIQIASEETRPRITSILHQD